jgi:hypothetical protein
MRRLPKVEPAVALADKADRPPRGAETEAPTSVVRRSPRAAVLERQAAATRRPVVLPSVVLPRVALSLVALPLVALPLVALPPVELPSVVLRRLRVAKSAPAARSAQGRVAPLQTMARVGATCASMAAGSSTAFSPPAKSKGCSMREPT